MGIVINSADYKKEKEVTIDNYFKTVSREHQRDMEKILRELEKDEYLKEN